MGFEYIPNPIYNNEKSTQTDQRKRERSTEHRLGLTGYLLPERSQPRPPRSTGANQFSLLKSSTRVCTCTCTRTRTYGWVNLLPILRYISHLSAFVFNITILIINLHTHTYTLHTYCRCVYVFVYIYSCPPFDSADSTADVPSIFGHLTAPNQTNILYIF